MRNDCSGGNDQAIVEFRARKVLGFCFGLKRLRRPRAPASDRGASPGDFEGHIPSMLVHPMIPSDLPLGLLPFLARRRLSLETPKSIALAGSQPSVSRRRPEALICIKAPAVGFDAIAGIAVYRSMPRSTPVPDSIPSLNLRTCSCRLSTAGEQAFGASEGVLARYALQSQSGSRESGALERRMAGDLASAFGVVGREGWLAPADLKTMAAAMPDCRLITVPGIGHSMNLESLRRLFGYLAHGSAGFPEMKSRFSFALKVHLR
jgi:pimeloyl-ACP methyl ester carboxylesterase